jgi:hypothetical protein
MLKAVFLVLALAGCAEINAMQEADKQQRAWDACAGIANSDIRDTCVSNYVNNAKARSDAEEAAVLGAMLSRPVQTSCLHIGSIVTCNSR